MLSLRLSKKGYKVYEAADGHQTIQIARDKRPDLVLLDVMMPEKNGWEVARELRNDPIFSAVGIVMLTAIGEKVNEMTSPLYGADEYVDKPFDFADLEGKIARVIAARKSAAQTPTPESAALSRAAATVPSLHDDIIRAETLWSCTACSACVGVCPVRVDPLTLITDLRGNRVGEGTLSGTAATALRRMQSSSNPWGLPAADRPNRAEGLGVPTAKENPGFEVL